MLDVQIKLEPVLVEKPLQPKPGEAMIFTYRIGLAMPDGSGRMITKSRKGVMYLGMTILRDSPDPVSQVRSCLMDQLRTDIEASEDRAEQGPLMMVIQDSLPYYFDQAFIRELQLARERGDV